MDAQTIEEFGRCTTEFKESVVAFGAIQSLVIQGEGMRAENAQREHLGHSIAYPDSAFDEISNEIDVIVKNLT